MEDEVFIGKKMTKKRLIKLECYLLLFAIVVAVGIFNVFQIYFDIPVLLNWIISILICIILVILITPVFGLNEVLEFTSQHISYYYIKGYIQQFKEVIRIFTHGQEIADISIATVNVSKVNLSYISVTKAWEQRRYKLKLTFLLRDGTTFFIFPTRICQMKSYEDAFQLLEKNNIEVVDKYHLRNYLSMNSYAFQKYIKAIKKDINYD